MKMMEYSECMKMLDEADNMTLYEMKNDLFDTAVLVYNEYLPNEETWVLTDMQGAYPRTIEEIGDYEWVRAEDVDW